MAKDIDEQKGNEFKCEDCLKEFLAEKVSFIEGDKTVDDDGYVVRSCGVAVCPYCYSEHIELKTHFGAPRCI